MTSSVLPVTCHDCGARLDQIADDPGETTPCAVCGSIKRNYALSISDMQLTDYALDNFAAHKLSLLTRCGASEMPIAQNWLGSFITRSIFLANTPSKDRAYIFNIIRRAEGSLNAYREARTALIEYVKTPRSELSPYFRSLLNFEVAIAQCYQGLELLARSVGHKLFEEDDGSVYQRLQVLYVDSKHMDRMISGGKLPDEATGAVWITNEGLESKRAKVTFSEIELMLAEMSDFARELASPTKVNEVSNGAQLALQEAAETLVDMKTLDDWLAKK